MIDNQKPCQPAKRWIMFAATLHLARRPDATAVGIDPQAYQEPRIVRRPTCRPLKRADRSRKTRQVEPAGQLPNRPDRMILVHQSLDIKHRPRELSAIRLHQSNLLNL
jgi:hypothetical protein